MSLRLWVLIVHTVFEIASGIVLLINPHVLFQLNDSGVFFARAFAFASISAGVLSFGIITTKSWNTRHGLSAIAVFHIGLIFTQLTSFQSGFLNPYLLAIHASFAIAFTYFAFFAFSIKGE